MTVRLTVQQAAWRQHVTTTAHEYGPALVPVVKGNGYGFGRSSLHRLASELIGPLEQVCVGTVHELHDVPANVRPVVLTPVLTPALVPPTGEGAAILTVGSTAHVDALRGCRGEVMVKLASTMRRFGATVDELPTLLRAIDNQGLGIAGYALHLPLAGTDEDRVAEIAAWLPHLPVEVPLWVSHLAPTTVRDLQAKYSPRRFKVRVGTALWHGVPKSNSLQVHAEVLHRQPIGVGEIAGYHHTPAPFDGTLVVIGAGSAHGIAANTDALHQSQSPFHFERARMTLLEPPHMHVSLAIVAANASSPQVGDWVDVQRPLITTNVNVVEWK